jgi:hypothetical protein
MIYAITREDGVTELHEDNYEFPVGAIELNIEQYKQLASGKFILKDGAIAVNPNPPKEVA